MFAGVALIMAGVVSAAQPGPAQRIVSLAPNLTELVYSAGAGNQLVGVDSFSDHPLAARSVPRIGDAFQIDYERVLVLRPDLVLAWQNGTPETAIARLQRLGLRVERVAVSSLEQIAEAIRRIGALAGTSQTAGHAADDYLHGIAQLRASRSEVRPVTVFYQISVNPLYTVSGKHLISEVITLCGGRNIFADVAQLAPPVSPEAVLERDPQVIITGDGAQGDPLALWQRWPQLQAVRRNNLYTVRADYLARATARVVLGAQEVCRALDQARDRQADRLVGHTGS